MSKLINWTVLNGFDSKLKPFTTNLISLNETDWKTWPIDVIFLNEKIDQNRLNI